VPRFENAAAKIAGNWRPGEIECEGGAHAPTPLFSISSATLRRILGRLNVIAGVA
jgi:hypothetical protein